jgi:hypothetical protein
MSHSPPKDSLSDVIDEAHEVVAVILPPTKTVIVHLERPGIGQDAISGLFQTVAELLTREPPLTYPMRNHPSWV